MKSLFLWQINKLMIHCLLIRITGSALYTHNLYCISKNLMKFMGLKFLVCYALVYQLLNFRQYAFQMIYLCLKAYICMIIKFLQNHLFWMNLTYKKRKLINKASQMIIIAAILIQYPLRLATIYWIQRVANKSIKFFFMMIKFLD